MYVCSIMYCLFKYAVSSLDYTLHNNGMTVESSKPVGLSSKIVNDERERENISVALYANLK